MNKFFQIFTTTILIGLELSVIFVTVGVCLRISNARCTIDYFKPYEYNIWQKCMNTPTYDMDNKNMFFLLHEYSCCKGEYKVTLHTENKCMDCWYAVIQDGPCVIYNSDPLYIGRVNFNEDCCKELAQKIIKDHKLTWENTHGAGEIEEKCWYHKIFK